MERHNGNPHVTVHLPWDNSPEKGKYKQPGQTYSYHCGKSKPLGKEFLPECMEDPELFFPAPSNLDPEPVIICQRCPKQAACLQMALDAEENAPANMRFGIYGGTRPQQRFALAKKLRQQKEASHGQTEGHVPELPASA